LKAVFKARLAADLENNIVQVEYCVGSAWLQLLKSTSNNKLLSTFAFTFYLGPYNLEIDLLSSLNHANIVHYLGSIKANGRGLPLVLSFTR